MARHLRGWALADLGRHAQALEAFRQAIALDPAMTYVQYKIALELSLLGQDAEALEAADAAIAVEPDDTAPLILRGAILFGLERYEEALDAFTSVLQREPGSWQVRLNRAQTRRRLGRYAEALADYDQTLRLKPGLTRARDQKGITLAMAGRYSDALVEFASAAAAAGGGSTGTADVWSAAIAWHRGDPAEARRHFEQAAGKPMGMNHSEAVIMQAVVSCALGHSNPAADLLGGQTGSADPASRDILTRLFVLLGDPPVPGIDQLRAIALGSCQQ
jgi:tetratricopeptide (TPR) repeat protein